MAKRFCRVFCRHFSNITLEDTGCVRIISINRPHVRNCVDRATSKELYDAFKAFDNDSKALVGVLTGSGEHFCSGYDLAELESFKEIEKNIDSFSADKQAPMVCIISHKFSLILILHTKMIEQSGTWPSAGLCIIYVVILTNSGARTCCIKSDAIHDTIL